MKKLKLFTYIAVLATVLFACKASAESEQKKFDTTKSDISKLATVYSRYSPLIIDHIANLDADWDEALKISNEEEKIEALQRVNKSAKTGVVKPLMDLSTEVLAIKDNMNFLAGRNAAEVEIAVLQELTKANETLDIIAENVIYEEMDDLAEATVEINGYVHYIQDANRYLDVAVKKLKKKDADEKAAKKAAANAQNNSSNVSNGSNTTNTTSAASTVKCKYCKTSYASTQSKCPSCGAKK